MTLYDVELWWRGLYRFPLSGPHLTLVGAEEAAALERDLWDSTHMQVRVIPCEDRQVQEEGQEPS